MFEMIEPFVLAVPQAELEDLRQRLSRTRWPDPETIEDVSQGPRLEKVRAPSSCVRARTPARRS